MMRFISTGILILSFISCETTVCPPLSSRNEESVPENESPPAKEEASQIKPEILLDLDKIKWVNHPATGILLHDSTALFNPDYSFNRYEHFTEPVEVSILEKSDKMVRTGLYEDFCKQAYLLKVNFLNAVYYIQGTQIYELNPAPLKELKWQNEDFRIETADILRIGASDDDGLTLCEEDYKIVLVRNLSKPFLKVIEWKYAEEDIRTPEHESFFVLFNNAGWLDECVSVKSKNEMLIFHIQRGFQEGGEEFDLCVWQEQDTLKSKIEDLVNYEFETPWDEP